MGWNGRGGEGKLHKDQDQDQDQDFRTSMVAAHCDNLIYSMYLRTEVRRYSTCALLPLLLLLLHTAR